MKRIYLTLLSKFHKDTTKTEIHFSSNSFLEEYEGLIRTSPIFSIDPDYYPMDFKHGYITVIYTLDTYNVISSINYYGSAGIKIFITHGIASIILLRDTDSISQRDGIINFLKNKHKGSIIGTEDWTISDNAITSCELNLPIPTKISSLNFNLEKISTDDNFLFGELLAAYNYFDFCCKTYAPNYILFSKSIKLQIEDLYRQICLCGQKDNNPKNNIDILIIRDEILQTTATLKAVNTQAFNGINILNSNLSRSGRYSLFGIGLCYSGVYQLYQFCQKRFEKLIFNINDFNNFISIGKAPDNIEENDFNRFLNKINLDSSLLSLDKLYNLNTPSSDSVYHLIYFSHRYGFREAKKSISIAKQSIPLGIIPSWSLNTFFHEFLHSHVRILLASILKPNEKTKNILNNIASNKTNICNHNSSSIKDFLQTVIYDCIMQSIIFEEFKQTETDKQKGISAEILQKGLRLNYDKINEIIVHTLDLHYFYNSDPELYIKAIWMSWLTLPATESRIPEYIIRTVCAIGTTRDESSLNSSYNWSLEKIKTVLREIQPHQLTNNSQIDMVVNYIDNIKITDSYKEHEYVNVWGKIAFITYKFLFSKNLHAEINYSPSVEMENDEFSLNIQFGNFDAIEYENPIKIIQKNLEIFFTKKSLDNETSLIESNSLYLYSLLSSTNFDYGNGI